MRWFLCKYETIQAYWWYFPVQTWSGEHFLVVLKIFFTFFAIFFGKFKFNFWTNYTQIWKTAHVGLSTRSSAADSCHFYSPNLKILGRLFCDALKIGQKYGFLIVLESNQSNLLKAFVGRSASTVRFVRKYNNFVFFKNSKE